MKSYAGLMRAIWNYYKTVKPRQSTIYYLDLLGLEIAVGWQKAIKFAIEPT